MTHDESWYRNFELLTAYIRNHHHLPDKKKSEASSPLLSVCRRFFLLSVCRQLSILKQTLLLIINC